MIISVFPYIENQNVERITRNVIDELSKLNCHVYVANEYKNKIGDCQVVFNDRETLFDICDIAIAIGGDGTTLRVAKRAAFYDKCVLGINGGRLGFMSGLEANELSLLRNVVNGKYVVDERMMLRADVMRKGCPTKTFHCLNDAVVTRGDYARLIDVTIHCDERPVWDMRADGVIVSTPTGSTAYSMAAGGPVISPDADCFLVTSICPHSLIDRSIVFPTNKELYVNVKNDVNNNSIFTADGKLPVQIDQDTVVKISKSEYTARLIKVKPENFYEILKKKIIERRS